MDIKSRIDALSEAEAKAALEQCLKTMENYIRCGDCRYSEILPDGIVDFCETPWNCKDTWLDEALKGARK